MKMIRLVMVCLNIPGIQGAYEYDGNCVPEVLISGHHEKIRHWRLEQSLLKTYRKRPDLLIDRQLSLEEQEILKKIKEKD